jgi:hypothetical protein
LEDCGESRLEGGDGSWVGGVDWGDELDAVLVWWGGVTTVSGGGKGEGTSATDRCLAPRGSQP